MTFRKSLFSFSSLWNFFHFFVSKYEISSITHIFLLMALNISQERSYIYQSLTSYFGNILAIKGKDVDKFSVYYANVSAGCLLCLEDRYLVIITDRDPFPLGNREKLQSLRWISFQTRTIDLPPITGMRSQSYKPIMDQEFLSDKINRVQAKDDRDVYFSDRYPLQIELLYTDNVTSYAPKGTIQTALDTFNCTITFTI